MNKCEEKFLAALGCKTMEEFDKKLEDTRDAREKLGRYYQNLRPYIQLGDKEIYLEDEGNTARCHKEA